MSCCGASFFLFQPEQCRLTPDSTGISGQSPLASHDPMTGYNQSNGIVPEGVTNGLCRHTMPCLQSQLPGQRTVCSRHAIGYAQQHLPHAPTKRSPGQMQRRHGIGDPSDKIQIEPRADFMSQFRVSPALLASGRRVFVAVLSEGEERSKTPLLEPKSRQSDGISRQTDPPQGRCIRSKRKVIRHINLISLSPCTTRSPFRGSLRFFDSLLHLDIGQPPRNDT